MGQMTPFRPFRLFLEAVLVNSQQVKMVSEEELSDYAIYLYTIMPLGRMYKKFFFSRKTQEFIVNIYSVSIRLHPGKRYKLVPGINKDLVFSL